MKKALSILAPVAAIVLSEGIVFKICHWPGCGFILLGGGVLAIIAIIVGMAYSLSQPGCKCTKWFVGLSLLVAMVAITFKLLHFPYGTVLCLASFGVLIPIVAILLAVCFSKKA